MLLSQILAGVPLAEKLSGDTEISAVELDSRKTVPGALFIALNGKNSDGRKFIPDALEKGAAAVLYDGDYTPPAADGVLFVRSMGVVTTTWSLALTTVTLTPSLPGFQLP